MCGACCRNLTVDLDPGEQARIARHDWAREDERFREGFVVAGVNLWNEPRDELKKQADGACIFLDRDGLCLVEKRLGRDAKPRICRKFPYVFVAAPDGERATVSVECASRWRSLADGAPVEAARAELERLAAESVPHKMKWRVQVAAEGRFLSTDEYLGLEDRLGAEIAEERPLAAMLGGLAAAVAALEERAEGPFEQDFDEAFGHALVAAGRAAIARGGDAAPVVAALAEAPGAAWRAALAAAEARPESAAFLRAVLAGWVWEALPGRAPSAEDGVGQMIFGAILIAALGHARAAEAGRPTPAELNLAAREVSLFLRNMSGRRVREETGGFAALCRAAVELAT